MAQFSSLCPAKLFDRDPETNEVLWFAAPPLDIAHPPGPQYSLEYLAFLARKRRKTEASADDMDVDAPSREQVEVRPTVTEQIKSVLSTLEL